MKWAFPLATILFGVSVWMFFAFVYPHHLYFQEQYQLFLFTQYYVCDVLSLPGGLATLLGRFLTQFFFYARIGAVAIALVLMCMQLMTYRLLRTSPNEIVTYTISFIPSVLCFCFLTDENALMNAPVALMIVLGMTMLIKNLSYGFLQTICALISIPITYMLAGSFAIPYALMLIIMFLRNDKSLHIMAMCVVMILIALIIPFVCHYLINIPLSRLYAGMNYYRIPDTFPSWAWSAMCVVPFLMLLPKRIIHWNPRRCTIVFFALWIVVMAIGGAMVNLLQSRSKEDTMAYDFMARYALWNRIIQKAQVIAPRNQVSAVVLNLALSQREMLVTNLYSFPQNGLQGLLPNFTSDSVSPLATAEAFYRLGLINTAQRFVFEAQEAIPDFQKSGRCYKRLAETNIINGSYDVARKYLHALQNTIYYRAWANETLELLKDEKAILSHPEYGKLREMRCNQDYFFGGNDVREILYRQLLSNKKNRTAYEYLEAACMLTNTKSPLH